MNWKISTGLILIMIYLIAMQSETTSQRSQTIRSRSYDNTAEQLSNDACNVSQWEDSPEECNELKKESKKRADKYFSNFK